MRDFWNNVPDVDDDAVIAETIEALKGAFDPKNYSYYEAQEMRNSAELCDRGHFQYIAKEICGRLGTKVPAGVEVILEDPDFDRRVSFMKAVVAGIDPAPAGVRAKR